MKPLLGQLAALILLMAVTSPACAALTQGTYTWWSLLAGAELNQALDNDPYSFQDAETRTASLYLSGGKGARWGILAFNDMRLSQDWWTFRGRRGMLRLREESATGLARGLWAFYSQGSQDWEGRGLGLELDAPPLGAFRNGFELSWTRHAWLNEQGVLPVQEDQQSVRVGLFLTRQTEKSRLRLAGFRQTLDGKTESAWQLRAGRRFGRTGITATLFHGRQSLWLDAESLVLHDGSSPLEGAASLSLQRPLSGSLTLRLGAGWTGSMDHENRWLFLGLAWKTAYWTL